MRIGLSTVSGLALAALLTTHAAAGPTETLYAGVGNGSALNKGGLLLVDSETGVGAFVGDVVTPGGLSGIDFNPLTGALFGTTVAGFGSTSQLVRINRYAGVAESAVAITEDDTGDPISIGDLAFQPGTGTLFGVRAGADGGGSAGLIYTIDITTGKATFIGDPGVITTGGIAFGTDGTLYWSATDATLATNQLHTLDTTNASILTTVTLSKNDFLFDGLGYRASDGLLYASEGKFGDNPTPDIVYTIDPSTGTVTAIGATGVGEVSDLAFSVAEPASAGLLGLGLLGLALHRRKAGGKTR